MRRRILVPGREHDVPYGPCKEPDFPAFLERAYDVRRHPLVQGSPLSSDTEGLRLFAYAAYWSETTRELVGLVIRVNRLGTRSLSIRYHADPRDGLMRVNANAPWLAVNLGGNIFGPAATLRLACENLSFRLV